MSSYSCEFFVRPGLEWPGEKKIALIHELRALAALCLPSVPDYQCLSLTSPTALNDKVIAVARRDDTGELIAFTSSVLFDVPHIGTIVHTGLGCIHPSMRRSSLTVALLVPVFSHALSMFPEGLWVTNLAAIPSSLVSIYQLTANVFPSPDISMPSSTHLAIAKVVSESHRHTMAISSNAIFDATSFVFRESSPPGSPFRKNANEPTLQHRNVAINNFYRDRLNSGGDGDEILQVAFLEPGKASKYLAGRSVELAKAKARASL